MSPGANSTGPSREEGSRGTSEPAPSIWAQALRRRSRREERRAQLVRLLEEDPFLTDEELARRLGVSVQTIRLDRHALGIPEMRARVRRVAQGEVDSLRSLVEEDLFGVLEELRLEERGRSHLAVERVHTFRHADIARGHILFAQANSLAVALVDAPLAVTVSSSVRFLRPARVGDHLVAQAEVVLREGPRRRVRVVTEALRPGGVREVVFSGEFVVQEIAHARGDRS